jgi:L-Ala-D/L-Glu epimerase
MNKDHSIVSVDVLPLNLQLHEPFSIATGNQDEVKNVLIKITLGNGMTGLGEAAPFPAVNGETQESAINAIHKLKSEVLNADIRTWKNISERISMKLQKDHSALCGIQMALVDALGKYYNISAGVLFGGSSDTLKTDMTIIASDVEHAGNAAKEIVKRKINTIKIKTAGKNIALDFERIKKIREVAPRASFILDGNCGYALKGALELVKKLHHENIPILFFEQPLPREQWKEMAIFTQESGVKVAADESARNAADVSRIAEEKSAHIINIKLMKSGLFEAMRMVEIAKAARLELMIGGMVETILSMSFSAHFAAGIGGFNYADLDTPLFIKSHPFKGGFELKGDIVKIDLGKAGHGVAL